MDRHKLEPPFDFGSLFQDALKHDNSILLDLLKENEDGFKSLLKNYLKDGDNWNHFLGQNVAKYARCPPPSNVVVAAGVDDTVLTLLSQMGSVDEQFLQAIQTVTDPFIEKKTKNLPSGVQGTNQGTSFTAAGGGGKSSNDSLKTVDDDATVHGPGSSLDIENNTNNNTNNSYNFSTMEGNEAGLGDASLDNASRLSSLNDAAPVSMAMDENTVEDSTERPRTPTGLLSALPAIAISNTTTAAESAATVHFGSPCTQDSTAVGAVTPRTPTTPSGTERDLLGCCCGGAGDRSINKRAAFHNTVRCILDHQPSLLATLKSIQTTATGSDSLSTNKDTNSKDGNNKTNEDSTVEYDADVAASAGKIAELLNALNARKKEQARDETQICGDGSRGRDTGGLQLKDDSSDATVKLGKRGRYCLDIWEEEEFIARTRSKTHTQLRPLYDWGDLFHSHAYDENHDGFYRDWLVSQQVEAKSEIRQKGTMTKRKKSAIDPIFKSVAPEVDTSSLASIKPPPVPVAIHHPACWGILHNDNSDRNQSRQTSASYRHPASLSRRVYSTNSTTNGAVIDAATATATATASAAATNSMPSGLHVHEKGSEAVPVSKRVSFSSLSNATNSTTTNTRTGSAPRRATTNNKADATTTATNTNNTSTNTTINRANLSPGSDGGSDIGETLDAMEEIEDVDDFNLYADTLAQQLLVEEANNFVRLTLLQQALATHRQSMKLSARRKRLEELFYQAVLKASMQNPYPLNPKKDNFIQRNNRLSDTSSFQRKQKNSSGVVQSIATVSGSARTTQFSLNNDSNSNNTNHLMSAPGDVSAGRYNTRCGISSGGVRANGKEELVAAAASRGWSRKHDLLGACAMQQVPHGALLPESVQAGEEVEVLVGKHWRVGLVRRLLTDGGLIRHVKVELLDELDAAEEEQNKAALKAVLQPSTSLPLDDSAADVDLGSAGAAESEVAAAPPPLPTPTTTTPTPTPLAEKQKIEYRSAPSVWVAIEDGRLAPYGTNLRKKRPTTTTTTMTMTQQKQQQQQQQRETTVSEEERAKAKLQELVDQIPTDRDALFAYHLDWQALDDRDIIGTVMKTWIAKKLVEYLGEEEESLTEFILTKLQEHAPAQEVLDELSMVLEDDAVPFMMKLWRMLVYYSIKNTATL
mmetsp:Transcript_26241/g.43740  ORF Transcript_26241/g.43740 Transcript_26241/m.43740 type:complete len:1152 (-) Transcript_26241:1806-5261(-)